MVSPDSIQAEEEEIQARKKPSLIDTRPIAYYCLLLQE